MAYIPTTTDLMKVFFADSEHHNDNYHWVLFKHGTFYTWPKVRGITPDYDGLIEEALKLSRECHIIQYKNNDEVGIIEVTEMGHPCFIVTSCMKQKIGWAIVGQSEKWPETEQQSAAVGYTARAKYELDCHENKIIAASFPYKVKDAEPSTETAPVEEKK